MTQTVQPGGRNTAGINYEWGTLASVLTDGYIIPPAQPSLAAEVGPVDPTTFNGFAATYSAASLNVTIGPGEAFVHGWLASDTGWSVTLPANATVTIYLGWDWTTYETDEVVVGAASAFENPRLASMPIWTFTTDGTGVVAATDERAVGRTISIDAVDGNLDVAGSLSVGGRLDAHERIVFNAAGSHRIQYDTDLTGDPLLLQRASATAETAMALVGTRVGINQVIDPQYPLHVGGNANIDGTLSFNGGSQAALREGTGAHRDVYVSSTQPTGWTDGDIWFEPE